MRSLLAALLLAAQPAWADGYYLAAGYDFIPGSADVSFGYEQASHALEAVVLFRGKEEPLTKPGPQLSLNVLFPAQTMPLFVKLGFVGGGGVRGYNAGAGYDLALGGPWAVRGQVTYYHATEDFRQAMETEYLVSLGLKYRF